MPTEIRLLWLSFGVYDNLHTHFIEVIAFVLIKNVEFYFMIFGSIGNFEKEPLWIPISINIILKQEIILMVGNLRNERKIATLESWLED